MKNTTADLKQKTINAGLWNISGNIASQAIRLGSNLILTRLLLPESFGLIAIAQTLIVGLTLFSDMGLRQSLIRSNNTDQLYINTIWSIKLIQTLMIWIISIAIAWGIYYSNSLGNFDANSVYSDKELPLIIVVVGFCSVITGIESANTIIAARNLNFKQLTIASISSQLGALIVMLAIANEYRTVWALVAGQVVATVLQVIFSYKFFPGARNHFQIEKKYLKELFHFGKWVFFCSIVAYLFSSSDKYVMGYLVDKNLLGQYGIAILIISAIKGLLTKAISSLGLPALSTAYRENPRSLERIFYKMRLPIDVASMFLMGFLYISGPTLIDMLYDHRYSSAGWMIQIFAIGFFEIRYKLSGEFYMTIGKPNLVTQLITLDLIILYAGMYFLYQTNGINGLIWAIACSSLGTIPLNLLYMRKHNILSVKREALTIPMLIPGLIAGYSLNYVVEILK